MLINKNKWIQDFGIDEVLDLVKRQPTVEVLTEEQLRAYLESGVELKHYIGFEISGFVHLGTGIVCMNKVADFQKAGIKTTIFLADYHSWINRKLGGDLDTIRKVGLGYFREALGISLKLVGGDPDSTNFILASKLYEKMGSEYFENVLKVSINTSLGRIRKGITIMGRKMKERISFAQLLYVPMQVADIYSLKVNVAHGGIDQRKAHVIAIEVWKEFGYKPVAVHNKILMGLSINEETRKRLLEAKEKKNREVYEEEILDIKMSKSKPESAIFIHGKEEEIRRKIMNAYCPFKEIELNPIIDIVETVIFPWLNRNSREFEIKNMKTGEVKVFRNYEDLKMDYKEGKIHPLDLKNAVIGYLIEMLEPARKHFLEGPGKKYLEELKELKVTR